MSSATVPSNEPCVSCGYELRADDGTRLTRCPECGTTAPEGPTRRWVLRMLSLGLTLPLWGLPLLGIAAVSTGRNLGSARMGNDTGSWSIAGATAALLEGAAHLLVIAGTAVIAGVAVHDRGRRRLSFGVLAGAVAVALLDLAIGLSVGRNYPWIILGAQQNGALDMTRTWVGNVVFALSVWVVIRALADAAGAVGLNRLAAVASRLAIPFAVLLLGVAILEAVASAASRSWANTNINVPRASGQPPRAPGTGLPTPPWYVISNAAFFSFWSAPVRGAVLAGVWTLALLTRAGARHMLIEAELFSKEDRI